MVNTNYGQRTVFDFSRLFKYTVSLFGILPAHQLALESSTVSAPLFTGETPEHISEMLSLLNIQ